MPTECLNARINYYINYIVQDSSQPHSEKVRFLYFTRIFSTPLSVLEFCATGFLVSPGFSLIFFFLFFFGFVRTPRFALLHGSHRVRPPFKFISPFTIPSLFLFSPVARPLSPIRWSRLHGTSDRDPSSSPVDFIASRLEILRRSWLTRDDDPTFFPLLFLPHRLRSKQRETIIDFSISRRTMDFYFYVFIMHGLISWKRG